MDIKVNQTMPVTQTDAVSQTQQTDGSFKFTLASHIEEQDLQVRLTAMMEEITRQGDRISKKMDIKDMRRYRSLVDRRGRHRVYGIIKQVDDTLDELARELVKDEKDHIAILNKIGEIRGLLLDIFT